MIYIGIDPDVDKSGVAIFDSDTKSFDDITTMSFWDLVEYIEGWLIPITVVIEHCWHDNKANFHGRYAQSKSVGETIGKHVGANHQVGRLLEEYCMTHDVDYDLVKPLTFSEKNVYRMIAKTKLYTKEQTPNKIKSDTFKKVTGYQDRTNQEGRDAALIVMKYLRIYEKLPKTLIPTPKAI